MNLSRSELSGCLSSGPEIRVREPEAEESFRQAMAADRKHEAKAHELRAAIDLSRLCATGLTEKLAPKVPTELYE